MVSILLPTNYDILLWTILSLTIIILHVALLVVFNRAGKKKKQTQENRRRPRTTVRGAKQPPKLEETTFNNTTITTVQNPQQVSGAVKKDKQVEEVLRRLEEIEKKFQDMFNTFTPTPVEHDTGDTKHPSQAPTKVEEESINPTRVVLSEEILSKAKELSHEIKRMAQILRTG